MKKFALAAVISAVGAQQDYNCANPGWTYGFIEGATDAASCGYLGTVVIESNADFNTSDWCLQATVQSEMAAVEADFSADPPVEA